jgi:sulfite exporter TauE/SafE
MLLWPLIAGVTAGLVHVVSGPDHLTAVAPLAADRRQSSWRTGLLWGVGHTAGILGMAGVALAIGTIFPLEVLSSWSERAVGVVLIVVGLWSARRAVRGRIHSHQHHHDGIEHVHIHLHGARAGDRHDKDRHAHTHAPLGIGVLHGLAGSAHLLAVIPALILPTRAGAAAYVAGFGVGSITAMTAISWLLGTWMQRWTERYARAYSVTMGILAALAIGIGAVWIATA